MSEVILALLVLALVVALRGGPDDEGQGTRTRRDGRRRSHKWSD